VFPTLVELCGLGKPEPMRWDGASLAPLLAAPAADWPRRALVTDSQRVPFLRKGKRLYRIKQDPAQKTDLAGKHPDVVKRLQQDYEKWWADITRRGAGFTYIVIGAEHESPSHICWHDWHPTPEELKTSSKARNGGFVQRGWWAVDIARDGEYEFVLRNNQIYERPSYMRFAKARLRVGDVDVTQDIPGSRAAFVVFRVKLRAGKTKLRTWLLREGQEPDKAVSARWVYAEHMELKKKRLAAGGLDYAAPPETKLTPVKPQPDGSFTIGAKAAAVIGAQLHYVPRRDDIGRWIDWQDYLEWRLVDTRAGEYDIELICGAASGNNEFVIEAGDAALRAKTVKTGAWEKYTTLKLGPLKLPAGETKLRVRATKSMKRALMNFKQMRLVPKPK